MNPHKDMELKRIWFKKGEYEDLTNALDCNENDEVLDILHEIRNRGDL